MECTIKILTGPDQGQEFHVSAIENTIGRSPRSQVRLSSPSISYEHALITRSGSEFFLENLSATGTFLREERITGKIRLRTRDQFRLGQDTTLRIESLPAGSSSPNKKRNILIAVVASMFLLLLIVILMPDSTNKTDLTSAYRKIDEWTQQEVAAGTLSPQAIRLLHDGWRLDRDGNRNEASQQWLRLSVLLDHEDDKLQFKYYSAKDRHALDHLLAPEANAPAPDDAQMSAALLQFVTRMADRDSSGG